MRSIDGRAGGGQLVRTAVSLAAVTGEAFAMTGVRGARETPGLKSQHVAAIDLVASVADARTEGVAVGSESFVFRPGDVSGGTYEAHVGTAGSLTLVFDTVLPLAVAADTDVVATVTGGTDVKWSPPLEYFRSVKLPTVVDAGFDASVTLDRRGFFPAGNGQATLTMSPCTPRPIHRERRGDLASLAVHSVASTSLEPQSVADRQADAAVAALREDTGVPIDRVVEYVPADDEGSALVVVARYEHSVTGFAALGEPGKRSEAVAADAVADYRSFAATDAAVDAHMADQLVPYLALAGGAVRIPAVTDHVESATDLVGAFEMTVEIAERGGPVLRSAGYAGP
ncbi:MAG: RNA 3'-terminal phosphate cyclase [Halanaeroarchaeum sp.]